mmetsp:Transcript_30139/g.101593  ORF Transcript_30139/g.101593 Transcript_30139/m.101593 type:complete len:203 (-) Transcript_30139:913-1521(-)
MLGASTFNSRLGNSFRTTHKCSRTLSTTSSPRPPTTAKPRGSSTLTAAADFSRSQALLDSAVSRASTSPSTTSLLRKRTRRGTASTTSSLRLGTPKNFSNRSRAPSTHRARPSSWTHRAKAPPSRFWTSLQRSALCASSTSRAIRRRRRATPRSLFGAATLRNGRSPLICSHKQGTSRTSSPSTSNFEYKCIRVDQMRIRPS